MNKSKKYKDKNRHKVKAQNKAIYKYKNPGKCSIGNCNEAGERHHENYEEAEKIIWLCRKHHRQIHGFIKIRCSEGDCDNLAHGKGLCKKHYAQKFRKQQGW